MKSEEVKAGKDDSIRKLVRIMEDMKDLFSTKSIDSEFKIGTNAYSLNACWIGKVLRIDIRKVNE